MFSPDIRPSNQSAIRSFVERLHTTDLKKRTKHEAEELAKFLIIIPREKNSVSHKSEVTLPDGRVISMSLCNTADATTVPSLIAAGYEADRLDLSVSNARGDQHGYSLCFFFGPGNQIEYREYTAGGLNATQIGCVFASSLSENGYHAFNGREDIPFDNNLQDKVYRQMTSILRAARATVTGKIAPPITP